MGSGSSTDCVTLFGKPRRKRKPNFSSVPITEDEFAAREIGIEDDTHEEDISTNIAKINTIITRIKRKQDHLDEKIKEERERLADLAKQAKNPRFKQEIESKMQIYKMHIMQKDKMWKTIEQLESLKLNLENAGTLGDTKMMFSSVHSTMSNLTATYPDTDIKEKLDKIEETVDNMKDLQHLMGDTSAKLSNVDDYDLEEELAGLLEEEPDHPIPFPRVPVPESSLQKVPARKEEAKKQEVQYV